MAHDLLYNYGSGKPPHRQSREAAALGNFTLWSPGAGRYHRHAGQKGEDLVKPLVMWCLPVLALLVLLSAGPAFAATATSSFQVTASVAANCTISSTSIDFGVYDPVVNNITNPLDQTGTVMITCTKGAVTTIELDAGQNNGLGPSGGTYRAMKSGSDYLSYNIYQDSNRVTLWSTGVSGRYTPPAAPNKNPRTFTTYGRVPAGQDVPSGPYLDSVIATVNF
jgi:spore coat protein U-like protein